MYFYGMKCEYSFVIPVYNRPQEIAELLQSMKQLKTTIPFQVVIVEDGSLQDCKTICDEFSASLDISYYYKKNTGPGASRNYGMERASGNYFIILDSDCLLPPQYLNVVDAFLTENYVDCFGGADAAHPSFTTLQKAINYTMTSFLTTGGIRGNKKAVQKFEPRSFNMGISQKAFEATGGFAQIHPGEDPDLSQRIVKAGFDTHFIPDAYVYHKRRISWKSFQTQVTKFGLVRPILNSWHPQSAKITFWLPTLFVCFCIAAIVFALAGIPLFLLVLYVYVLLIFIDAMLKSKNAIVALQAVFAMFIQFFGYGIGFWISTFYIRILGRNPEKQFPNLFFKKMSNGKK